MSYPKDFPLLHWPLVNSSTRVSLDTSFLPSSTMAAESLQWWPYYFYFSRYVLSFPVRSMQGGASASQQEITHIVLNHCAKSFLMDVKALGYFLFFLWLQFFPVSWLHSSLDERNLSWHRRLVHSLPDHSLLHFLSSHHTWQALPSHSAIELWGILASSGCLSKVTWKYMLAKSRNTHRRNSNR